MCTQLPSAPLRGPQVCPQDINVHSWKTTEMSPRGTFSNIVLLLLKKKKILFIYFERERKGRKEGEKHQYARETWIICHLHTPSSGPGPQPRHVP